VAPSVMSRRVQCLTVVGAAAVIGVLAVAAPVSAHVEVTGAPAQAGAANAVLTFTAEAESPSAGIVSMRVVLPTGMVPADVAYLDGPAGWRLTSAADGYTVAGPAVPVGQDARYRVRVRQLPQGKTAVFKTIETYSNGKVSRWIGEGGADNPAPVLTLAPAAVVPTPTATPTTTSPSPSVSATTGDPSTSPAAAADSDEDGGLPALAWVGIGVAILAALLGGVFVLSRRAKRP